MMRANDRWRPATPKSTVRDLNFCADVTGPAGGERDRRTKDQRRSAL
jgi:hypothetical protein